MVDGCGYMRGFRQVRHGIFAHSRPVKTGTPRLLPHPPHIPPCQGGMKGGHGLSAKETAQMPCLICFNWFDFEGE